MADEQPRLVTKCEINWVKIYIKDILCLTGMKSDLKPLNLSPKALDNSKQKQS